jgi:small subunit ribosomal protein S20
MMSIGRSARGTGRFPVRLTLVGALAIEHPIVSAQPPLPEERPRAPFKDHIMANTKSAKKAARQTVRRTAVNKARRTRLRSSVREVEEAIASGNKEAAAAALKKAEPVLARNAQKGVVHRKTASRKVSRLAKRISAMGAP